MYTVYAILCHIMCVTCVLFDTVHAIESKPVNDVYDPNYAGTFHGVTTRHDLLIIFTGTINILE